MQIDKYLKHYEQKLFRGIEKGLRTASNLVLERSNEIVPTDDEDLMASGKTEYTRNDNGAEATISYDEPYAVEVHEDLEVPHGEEYNKKHADDIAKGRKYFYKGRYKTYHARRPQEQAKYLESAAQNSIDEIGGILRHAIRSELKK